MKVINQILNNVSSIKKLSESSKGELTFSVFGAGVGEKIVSLLPMVNNDQKVVYVAKDHIEFLEVKDCLENIQVAYSQIVTDLFSPTHSQIKDNSWQNLTSQNLFEFCYGNSKILLINAETLLYKFKNKINKNNYLKLFKNQKINIQEIIEKLLKNGFNKCKTLEKQGDFTVRGDILDIFLNNYENPVRIDFFDDEIDNIYFFDINEMKKISNVEEIDIISNKLNFFSDEQTFKMLKKLKKSKIEQDLSGDAQIKIHTLISQIENGITQKLVDNDINFVLPFYENEYTIFDLLPDAKIVLSDAKQIFDTLKDEYKSVFTSIGQNILAGELLQEHSDFYFTPLQAIKFVPDVVFAVFEQNIFKIDEQLDFRVIGSRNYVFNYKALLNDVLIYSNSSYKVVLFAGSQKSKQALADFFASKHILFSEEILPNSKFQLVITDEYFSKSFSFLDSRIIAIGTDDLIKKTMANGKSVPNKNKRNVFYLPKVGDFVVHNIHGIGKCVALEKLNLNGTEKDYFVIEYSGGDKLYLPSEQADLISAYLGADSTPKLHKIGGEQFAKVKAKVRESVSKLAIDLLQIYAEREKSKGFVYEADNALMNEFENTFEYTETADQLSAIADIKKDMESNKVMDRLICGDVGYGKTEVALRAIYKAILSGKQVAFLCPTTILSQQHYETAKARFKDFMVNVAVLNRFKTKSQQEQILKDTREGKVDLLIGTHRILSNDVCFKNLGLLVLDEEQRFGVGDKEKIKELKKNVDVLTLSATPIPRTLNMALTGIRDISIIETPPKERIAIKTYVAEENDTLIFDACKKEFARGGQVLYVFNRVEYIYEQVKRIKELLPNARVGVAHGQMPEKLLEKTILELYNGEYDIMVATTLIESGIDLPLANTLIVIDADRLGLSELYQLRGRIGRSNRVAYAYFTYNPTKSLTEDAYKRLDAIMEYTELGSGFKIAMRDLEIRGAGNVLGKEQHGHMEKVGYDMYCKLLEDAIKELKGEKVKLSKPIKMDIAISANLPNGYVDGENDRINLYSKISTISNDNEFEEMLKDLEQTFGEPPKEAVALLKIAYLKNLCANYDVRRVLITSNLCKVYFYKMDSILPQKIGELLSTKQNGTLSFENGAVISFDMEMSTTLQKLDFLLEFFKMANV